MKRKIGVCILTVICLVIAASGCGKHWISTMHIDEGIDGDIREEVAVLDKSVIQSIKNHNADAILDIGSRKLIEEGAAEWVDMVFELVKDAKIEYVGRYYACVDKPGNQSIVLNPTQDVPYYVSTQAYANQIFVSLMSATTDSAEYMLSFTYVIEDGAWKVVSLYVGEYKVHGMSAVDLYEKAVKLYDDDLVIPAAMYAGVCSNMIRPSSAVQYKQEAEMMKFIKKVAQEVEDDYTIPFKLSTIDGVEVYSMQLIYVKEGLVPSIRYITNIDMDREDEIQREAKEIHQALMVLFDGMDESFDVFVYKAFAEPPLDPSRKYRAYTTIIE